MVSDYLAQFMLKLTWKVGLVLRMMNKESVKDSQNEQDHHKPHRGEYQTVRLFAILGVLTILFVLIIRLAQNDTYNLIQRLPTSTSEIKK